MRLALAILFLAFSARAEITLDWSRMRPDLWTNVMAMPYGWGANYTAPNLTIGEGSWYHRFNTGNWVEGFTLTLPAEQPAGLYHLWIYSANSDTGTNVISVVTIGGASITNNCGGPAVWRHGIAISNSTAFTTMDVVLYKDLLATNSIQSHHLAGYVLTTNAESAPFEYAFYTDQKHIFVNYNISTVTNASVAPSGNLLPNSSLELGLAALGWSFTRNRDQGAPTYAQRMTDAERWTGGSDGDGFASIRADAVYYALQAPVIRLTGGREKRRVSVSYEARSVAGGSLITTLAPVLGQAPGYSNNTWTWTQTIPANTNWARYSTNFYLAGSPSREFKPDYQSISQIDLDKFQIEEGPLTAWAPRKPVEYTLYTKRFAHIFNFGETPTVFVRTYNNSGSTAARTLTWEVRDSVNRLLNTGSQDFTFGTGKATNALTITLTNLGPNRIVARMSGDPFWIEECVVSIAPLVASTQDSNSFWGIHGEFYGPLALSNKLWGMTFLRTQSPGGQFRMSVIEAVDGVYDFTQADYRVAAMTNMNASILFGSLNESTLPAYAITNGVTKWDAYSNYCKTCVARFPVIRYWETSNEILQQHELDVLYTAQVLADQLTAEAGAVKTANPNAYFVALGGSSSAVHLTKASNAWNLLSATTKGQIDAISVHLYPNNTPATSSDDTRFELWRAFGVNIGRPILNTETGSFSYSGRVKGDVSGWTSDALSVYLTEPEEVYRRRRWDDTFFQIARSFGNGYLKYIFYDGRGSDSYSFRQRDSNATWHEYGDEGMKPDFSMVCWLHSLFDVPTSYKKLTHPSSSVVEAYLFGVPGGSVIWSFSSDHTNRSLTIASNPVGVHDAFGNLVTTNNTVLPISYTPRTWISTLATNVLEGVYTNGTLAGVADVVAPNVSINTGPAGIITSTDFPIRYRWLAQDEKWRNTTLSATNVVTRYRLVGSGVDWSGWSESRVATYPTLANGTYHLEVEAKDFQGNTSPTESGPEFLYGVSTGGATAQSVTVGTLYGK